MKLIHISGLFVFLLLFSPSCVDGFGPVVFQTCVFLNVGNCVGIPNGIYADCSSCSGFVTCTFGADAPVPCPGNTMYDVASGTCIVGGVCDVATLLTANPTTPTTTSSTTTTTTTTPETMNRVDTTTTATTATTTIATTKAPTVFVIHGNGFIKTITFQTGCINSCQGQITGYFHSCNSCSLFFICNHYYWQKRKCYGNAKWDDVLCRCVEWSSTCQAVVTPTLQRPFYYRSWWR